MTLDTSPQQGRLALSAPKAAKILRLDVRTVRHMIEHDELAGYVDQGPKHRRWYVYADQLVSAPADRLSPDDRVAALTAEVQRLQADNTDLRAKLVTSEEANQILLAAQATQREAFVQYRRSVDEILKGAAGYRQAAEHFERATIDLQASGAALTNVIDGYNEVLIQYSYAGHLGEVIHTQKN